MKRNDFKKCYGYFFQVLEMYSTAQMKCPNREKCLRYTEKAKDVEYFIIPVFKEVIENKCTMFLKQDHFKNEI